MTDIETYARELVASKTKEEKSLALSKLKKSLKKHDKYDRDYMIGYRRSKKRGQKNPFNSEKESAKWDGFYYSQNDISALADEQS